ncbi:MAG: hypothetical protein U0946_01920 [Patescibacteria group bacterium]|nr:hypothetical protein [Patescibacteria group bacterium]
MLNQPVENFTPEIFLESLKNLAGCTQAGLSIAQEMVRNEVSDLKIEKRTEPFGVDEARAAANRGVLGTAVEWAMASTLTPQGKIDLIFNSINHPDISSYAKSSEVFHLAS